MFEALRKMILPIIIIVLVFFLGMIVLQWGLDLNRSGGGARANVAGTVNGEDIPWQAFSRTFNNLIQNERANRGDDYEIPDDRARQLERVAWDQLVADRAIKQEASRLGLKVTDTDVYEHLKYNPPQYLQQAADLQTEGQFDYQKYLSLMADPSAASLWAEVEMLVREDLKRVKVASYVSHMVHVTEEEVKQAFINAKEKVTVGLVNAPWSRFNSLVQAPTEEERQSYFEAHHEDYPVEERVVLDIIKIDKTPSEFDKERARALAQEIYDSVTTGSDFAEFAQIYSEDPGSGGAGGDLGWFAQGRMVKEFDSAAFAMDEGDISVPIKTTFGWHVLKHHGYRDQEETSGDRSKTVRQAHVSHILVKEKISAETLQDLWDQLDLVRTEAETVGYETAAETEGFEIQTSVPTEADGFFSALSTRAQDLPWAFEADRGEISDIIDLPNAYALLRLNDKLPAGLAELNEVATAVDRDWRNEKLARIARDTLVMVHEALTEGATLKDAAERYALTYDTLNAFSRSGSVPKIGSDPVIIGTAFGLPGRGSVTRPLDYATGTAIIELLDRVTPDLTEYNENRDSVFDATLTAKQSAAYQAWYSQLIDNADVESNVDFTGRR